MDKMTDARAVEVLAEMREDGGVVSDADYTAAIDHAIARLREPVVVEGLAAKWRAIARGDRRDGDEFTANRVEACADDLAAFPAPQPPAEAQAQGGGEVVAYQSRVTDKTTGEVVYDWSPCVRDAYIAAKGLPHEGDRLRVEYRKLYTAPPSEPVGDRPLRDVAEIVIGAYLLRKLGAEPAFEMTEDGDDGWAFWIADGDTTSYLHADLRVEWLGTSWEPSAPVGVEDTRGAFDRWVAKRHGCGTERWADSGKYRYDDTNAWWECWQTALAQQPAAVDGANRSRRMQKLWLDEWLSDYDVEMTSDAYAELLDALATQHQGPKS